jgi:uncharacterized membrane protein (DUF485 family)
MSRKLSEMSQNVRFLSKNEQEMSTFLTIFDTAFYIVYIVISAWLTLVAGQARANGSMVLAFRQRSGMWCAT